MEVGTIKWGRGDGTTTGEMEIDTKMSLMLCELDNCAWGLLRKSHDITSLGREAGIPRQAILPSRPQRTAISSCCKKSSNISIAQDP